MLKVVPYGVKITYYAFMACMFPVYITYYPLINFASVCQIHLFLLLAGFLINSRLFISMTALALLIPQTLWWIDLMCETIGIKFVGGTKYMYNSTIPLYVRIISLYHGWLPFLLIYLVKKVGYDQRAVFYQFILSHSIAFLSYYNSDIYNGNINLMKDVGIISFFFFCPIAMFITHRFLLWWV